MTDFAAAPPPMPPTTPSAPGPKRGPLKTIGIPALALLVGAGLGAAGAKKDTTTAGGSTELTNAQTQLRAAEAQVTSLRSQIQQLTSEKATSAAPSPSPAPVKSTAPSLQSDQDWTLLEASFKRDFQGDIAGTLRVRNDGGDDRTGIFTVTLFQGGKTVGTAQGSANGVAAGKTATVQLVSQDPLPTGKFTYEFQVDSTL